MAQTNVPLPGNDIPEWEAYASNLMRLKMCMEYAKDFMSRFSKQMSASDRVKLAEAGCKYDEIYWKYWEKLIKKIRGI